MVCIIYDRYSFHLRTQITPNIACIRCLEWTCYIVQSAIVVIALCTHSPLGNILPRLNQGRQSSLNKMSSEAPASATAPATARKSNRPEHQLPSSFCGCLPVRLKSARVTKVQATPEFKNQLQQHITSLNDKAKQVTTSSLPTYLPKCFSLS